MQRHRGLARARAAGDLGDPAFGRPDRVVLLLLDGGDDVAHRVTARAGQRRHQRAVADYPHVRRCPVGVQQVVGEIDDLLARGADHPAAHHVQWMFGGGLVERRRQRGPPVHQQVVELRVADAQSADVRGIAVGEVQAPEHEPLGLRVQRLQRPVRMVEHHVPLVQRLRRGLLPIFVALVAHRLGFGTQLVESGVNPVDVLLLDRDLGLLDGRFGHLSRTPRLALWADLSAYDPPKRRVAAPRS